MGAMNHVVAGRARVMRAAMVVALAAGAMSVSSCISAEQRDYVKYDAGKDEFRMLMVLSDIQVTGAEDLGYLEGLYKNRDHWIAPAIPGGANVMPLFGWTILRMSDKEFVPLNIFASRPGGMDKAPTEVGLSSVTVLPGAFFAEGGKLGYYQGVTVPGKTIDAALGEISKVAMTDDLTKAFSTEVERRAGGGKVHTWEELKAQTVKGITMDMPTPQPIVDGATPVSEEITPPMVLSEQSLKMVQAAVVSKTLALKRAKSVISTSVPLTAADAAGLADVWKAMLDKTEQAAKEAKETPENKDRIVQGKALAAVGRLVKVEAGSTGLTASVDLVNFAQAIAAGTPVRVDMNDKTGTGGAKPAAPDAAAYLKDKGIAIEAGLTATGIVKDFQAGTLKGHPSGTPVSPGEGIAGKQGG